MLCARMRRWPWEGKFPSRFAGFFSLQRTQLVLRVAPAAPTPRCLRALFTPRQRRVLCRFRPVLLQDRAEMFCAELQQWVASCMEKVITFKVPSDPERLEAWARAIPRKDRQLTPRDYVCEKHFSDSDIDRRRYYGELGGEVLLDKPKRPVLLRLETPCLQSFRAVQATCLLLSKQDNVKVRPPGVL